MSFTGINNLNPAINSITTPEAKPATDANESRSGIDSNVEPAVQVEHADRADLSSAGGLVAQALEGSDTRSAKVASLQQAIATGNYSVSSSDVAEKIIESLLK